MLHGESSSNSSNDSSNWRYHVFLSYSGEGTHLEFTYKLFASFQRKGIKAFPLFQDVIWQERFKEIEQCLAAIVVLSESYASSTRCLDELQKIIESKRVLGREVFPVFYGVSPSDVRHQRNSFAEALGRPKEEEEEEKVQKWRYSLKEVANISGWESKNYRHEAELIEDIVESVWKRLYPKIPSCNDGLVGIDSRVKKIDSLLSIELDEVRFMGIWGMGGIGKSTLARVVFEKTRDKFGIGCFLDNVREICGERDGMLRLQRTLLSHVKIKGKEIEDVEEGKNKIRNLLFNKKVLLVIDDVDDISQLWNLAEKQEWFGPGSRVIITTRDKQLLTSHGIAKIYKIDLLNWDESLQLLCQKAFKNDQPQEHCLESSKAVVQYAGGLPMALELLCSFLCGKSASQWKEVLDTIKEDPSYEIVMKSLRRSYEGLEVRYKILFLDIACFFKGREKKHVTQILQNCGRYPPTGIEVLVEKSLVNYDGLRLEMHDLLQEMGRDVVFEECLTDASKRSRLWSLQQIDEVLQSDKASEFIQGIVLKSSTEPYEAMWDPEALSKMRNLKILIIKFHNMKLPLGLRSLCSSLKVLHWTEYPLESLPLGVRLDEIVDLKMRHSKLKRIWKRTQPFAKLKFIDLSFSKDLIQTPMVSGVPCLEILLLEGCTKLVEVHQSVGKHKKLVILNFKDCINLQTLPSKLKMESLEELILSGCSKIKRLPAFGKNMECLSLLSLENCKNLNHLPNSICNLKSLRKLNISGCSKLSWLPKNMKENGYFEELDVSGTAIGETTSSKIHLKNIKEVSSGGSGRKELVSKSNSWNLLQWISKFRKE